MPPELRVVRSERADDVVVLFPTGDFDIDGCDILRSALAEALAAAHHKVVVELSGTSFLDSTALGTIVGGAKRAVDCGGWLRLAAPTAYVDKVLRVMGLDTTLGVFDSVEHAIRWDPDGDALR